MHFAVDGKLWEGFSPDLYDKMVGGILAELALGENRFTLLGKTVSAPSPVAGIDWQQTEERIGDKLFRDGWLQKTLPRALDATKDAAKMTSWISWEGRGVGGEYPQWLFPRGISKLLWPERGDLSPAVVRGFKTHWNKLLQKPGTSIITFSTAAAGLFKTHLGAGENIVRVLPALYPTTLSVASWEEKEQTKALHSGGKEYFLWIGSPGNRSGDKRRGEPVGEYAHWTEALKAFSIFKRGQRSQMQLLMAPWEQPAAGLLESLASYKYRADVQVIDPTQAPWQELIRSAYALLYIPRFDELGWVPGMAMDLEIPLISTLRSVAREWAPEAVLWVTPESPDSVAEAMIRVYKDETFRGSLLHRGRSIAASRKIGAVINQYEQVLTSSPSQ